MAATIKVHDEVPQELDMLKKETGVESYEEVIKILLRNAKKLRRTHFETLPKLKTFWRSEADCFER